MIRTLSAGISQPVGVQGERFYFSKGDYEIVVKAIGGSDSREYKLREGMGFTFKEGSGFHELEIKNFDESVISQTIEFEISYREVFDSGVKVRADGALPVHVTEGSIDVNGLLQIVNNGGISRDSGVIAVPAGVATQLRAANANRLKVAFSFPADVYLGKDNTVSVATGFPMASGSKWVDENTAVIWIYSATAINVPFIEDLK